MSSPSSISPFNPSPDCSLFYPHAFFAFLSFIVLSMTVYSAMIRDQPKEKRFIIDWYSFHGTISTLCGFLFFITALSLILPRLFSLASDPSIDIFSSIIDIILSIFFSWGFIHSIPGLIAIYVILFIQPILGLKEEGGMDDSDAREKRKKEQKQRWDRHRFIGWSIVIWCVIQSITGIIRLNAKGCLF